MLHRLVDMYEKQTLLKYERLKPFFWRSYDNFNFLSLGLLFGPHARTISVLSGVGEGSFLMIPLSHGHWFQPRRGRAIVSSNTAKTTTSCTLPSLFVAETSGFLWILADFQWFLAKKSQFPNCFTRKKRSNFFRKFFWDFFGMWSDPWRSFRGVRTNRGHKSILLRFLHVFLPYKHTFLHFVLAVSPWKK